MSKISNRSNLVSATVTVSGNLPIANLINVDATAGHVTLTLPDVSTSAGMIIWIYKIDSSANTVILQPKSGERMNAAVNGMAVLYSQDKYFAYQCQGERGWFRQ